MNNIVIVILMIVGGAAGLTSTLYICVSLIGTLAFKIYRKLVHGISLYK